VPIKSLLGHRSQASPQVRHISGQHIKEFTDFLAKHPDIFRVTEDNVVLLNFEVAAAGFPQSDTLQNLPQPSIDIKNTQQILDFFAQCIEIKGPILVDQLFHLVTSNFPQEHWYRIFKTPNDLTTFLKLFSDCFHLHSNLVTLLQKPKINENHIQHAQKVIYKNQLNYSNSSANANAISTPVIGDFKLNEPVSNTIGSSNNKSTAYSNKSDSPSGNYNDDSYSNGRNSTTDMPSMGYNPSFNEIRLENLCTKNCPATKMTFNQNTHPMNQPQSLPPTPQQQPAQQQQAKPDRRVNLTLKQRISNLVTKTLAENEEKDKQSLNALQPINNGSVSSSNSSSTATSPVHSRNYFMGDTWKIKVLQNTRVISTIKESTFVCEAIVKSAPGEERVIISFDCEGVSLGSKGQLTVIEIGTIRGEAFIFDLQQCPQMVLDGGLKELLEDENVIKIIHDCRNDSFNLYSQYNILLRNVFDTQVSHCKMCEM